MKTRILFLCTRNSCRSQMAEGFARSLKADTIDAYSAGTAPGTLDPRAVQAMQEVGLDISCQRAKNVSELEHVTFDWVVTVCGHADENCPAFPGPTRVVHVGFDDPPQLAAEAANEEEALEPYRRVRDKLRAFVEVLPGALEVGGGGDG